MQSSPTLGATSEEVIQKRVSMDLVAIITSQKR